MPDKPSTKALLIDAGEKFFGWYGFDGISLREIAAAAKQANRNVIQYHFKDKSGLIGAILKDRAGRIEVFRRKRLAGLGTGGPPDPREVLKVCWLPLLMVRGAEGSHTFCRFLMQYVMQRHVARHPLHGYERRTGKSALRKNDLGSLVDAIQLLRTHYKDLPDATFDRRLSALSMMFLASVVEHDNACLHRKGAVARDFGADTLLDMSIGAFSAAVTRK